MISNELATALAIALLILVVVYCYNLMQGARLKAEATGLVKTAHAQYKADQAQRSNWSSYSGPIACPAAPPA